MGRRTGRLVIRRRRGAWDILIDCPHGTTRALGNRLPREELLAAALAHHEAQEGPRGCRCTARWWPLVRARLARN